MERTRENKLGTMPIGPLLTTISIPIVLSMLVQALYNIVDSVFVAQLSEDALTAVSLAFPVQNLMIAVGVGTSVGIGSLLGRRLGEKNFDSANRTASNGMFLSVCNWVLFAVLGGFFSPLFYRMVLPLPALGAPDYAQILAIQQMGTDYLRIVTIVSFGLFISVTCERLLQSTGRSMLSMATQMSGAIVNIILDPIMIFGLLGFPAMGVAGAALATVVGQFVGMFVGLFANFAKNHDIKIQLRGFRPNGKTIKHIYQVGLPGIIMQSIGSVMVFGMNLILGAFSTTAVAVLGVYYKLQSFIFMPVFGFNNGMVSIVAYNFGARNRTRIEKTVRLSAIVCFCIMLAGTILFWAAPGFLLSLFNASPQMLEIGKPALRVISLCFPAAAISIIFSGVFQALGKGVYSLLMSIVRQLVFILPAAWLLAKLAGLDAVWFSFVLAEIVALVLAIFFYYKAWQNQIRPLVAEGDPDALPTVQDESVQPEGSMRADAGID